MTEPAGSADRQRALDQQALAILRSGGGWNARTRARLAAFARLRGVAAADLVAGALRALGGGSAATRVPVQGTGPVAGSLGSGAAPVDTSGGAAAPRSGGTHRGTWLGALALLVAIPMSIAVVLFAARQGPRAVVPPADAAASGRGASAPEPGGRAVPSSGGERAPALRGGDGLARPAAGARDVPPVPAIYARPPSLRIDSAPAWARSSLESVAAEEALLESSRARLAAGAAASDADRAGWVRMSSAFCGSWPLLGTRRQADLVEALSAAFPRLGDAEARNVVRGTLESMRTPAELGPEAAWRGSGAAGLLAAIDARGSAGNGLAFGEAALQWLAPRTAWACDAVLAGDPARAADAVDAWLQATMAATESGPLRAEREPRVAALVDLMLRRGAALERPGVAADAAGTLLDALGWTAEPARRARIAGAFRAWLEDPAITSMALHGLTSVLAARRPGSWWEPWLVVAERADLDARSRTADRFAAALSAAPGESAEPADAPRIRGVRPETVERWVQVARRAMARRPAPDPAARIAHAAELVAMVEALRLLERGRASEADARVAQVDDGESIAPDALDRWKGRTERPVGRSSGTDGRLEGELRARGSLEDRMTLLRSLRTRAVGDLGPVDASVLAREALAAPSQQVRSVAQGVVVDAFAAGPNVVAALLAEVPAAVDAGEAASLAAMVSAAPAPRGPDDRRRSAAMLLLLDHHASLVPSDRHGIDAVSREFSYSADAVVRALGGDSPGVDADPAVALRAWVDARAADLRPLLPPAALDGLLRSAQGRRRLAQPGPQAAVAELSTLVELEAALLAERFPRRRSAAEAVAGRARADRAAAPDVFAQLGSSAQALLDVALLGVTPDGGVQ